MHLVVYCNIMNSTSFWQNSSVGGAQWCKQSSGKSLRREEEQSLQWRVMQVILLSRQGRTGAVWKSAEWRLIFTLGSFSLKMHSLNCFSTPHTLCPSHSLPIFLLLSGIISTAAAKQVAISRIFLCEQANSTLRWHKSREKDSVSLSGKEDNTTKRSPSKHDTKSAAKYNQRVLPTTSAVVHSIFLYKSREQENERNWDTEAAAAAINKCQELTASFSEGDDKNSADELSAATTIPRATSYTTAH